MEIAETMVYKRVESWSLNRKLFVFVVFFDDAIDTLFRTSKQVKDKAPPN
jgi:hypothetical protein